MTDPAAGGIDQTDDLLPHTLNQIHLVIHPNDCPVIMYRSPVSLLALLPLSQTPQFCMYIITFTVLILARWTVVTMVTVLN